LSPSGPSELRAPRVLGAGVGGAAHARSAKRE